MKTKSILAETDRLILRRYEEDDLQDLYEYLSNPKVVEYEPYKTKTLKETEDNLKWRVSSDEMIAVELKSAGKMIGNVYLGKRDFESLEIGYVFNEDIASAYGITNANPQFGKGGLPQYYIPNVQELIDKGILTPVDSIKLTK